MKNQISKNFHVPLNSLSSMKTARSSLPKGHMGGANWGYLESGPGTHGLQIQEKSSSGPRFKYTHSGHNTQRSFDPHPPPPPPQKRDTQVREGKGVKIQNIIGELFLVLK